MQINRNQTKYYKLLSSDKTLSNYLVEEKDSSISPHSTVFVTIHRDSPSAQWRYISNTDQHNPILSKYLHYINKIEAVSVLAAQKLGEVHPECLTIVLEFGFNYYNKVWIRDVHLHLRKSKWNQYLSLSSNPQLIPFLPETNLLTKSTLIEFIKKYKDVIIKPCYGRYGLGIIKITMIYPNRFQIQTGNIKQTFLGLDKTYEYILEKYLSQKPYIIQKRLNLAEINNCPIDIRVIVQRKDYSWKTTGKLVKIASDQFFVTNTATRLLHFKDLTHALNIASETISNLEAEINKICISACKQLEINYPDILIIGFDIGLSQHGDIWIIEGNYKPDLSMFLELGDKETYRKITRILKGSKP